jgi:hypothetical protein
MKNKERLMDRFWEKVKIRIETCAWKIKGENGETLRVIGDKIYNKLIEYGMSPDDEFLKCCHNASPLINNISNNPL